MLFRSSCGERGAERPCEELGNCDGEGMERLGGICKDSGLREAFGVVGRASWSSLLDAFTIRSRKVGEGASMLAGPAAAMFAGSEIERFLVGVFMVSERYCDCAIESVPLACDCRQNASSRCQMYCSCDYISSWNAIVVECVAKAAPAVLR